MATPTYTAIASITLGSSASSVEFSSIPQDYRDLVLVVNAVPSGNGDFELKLNADTANSSAVYMFGNGSSAVSFTETSPLWAQWNSGAEHVAIFQIMDYSATDKHKTTLGRVNRPAGIVLAGASRWANTTSVTSLVASLALNNFNSGSTFSLFGIAS